MSTTSRNVYSFTRADISYFSLQVRLSSSQKLRLNRLFLHEDWSQDPPIKQLIEHPSDTALQILTLSQLKTIIRRFNDNSPFYKVSLSGLKTHIVSGLRRVLLNQGQPLTSLSSFNLADSRFANIFNHLTSADDSPLSMYAHSDDYSNSQHPKVSWSLIRKHLMTKEMVSRHIVSPRFSLKKTLLIKPFSYEHCPNPFVVSFFLSEDDIIMNQVLVRMYLPGNSRDLPWSLYRQPKVNGKLFDCSPFRSDPPENKDALFIPHPLDILPFCKSGANSLSFSLPIQSGLLLVQLAQSVSLEELVRNIPFQKGLSITHEDEDFDSVQEKVSLLCPLSMISFLSPDIKPKLTILNSKQPTLSVSEPVEPLEASKPSEPLESSSLLGESTQTTQSSQSSKSSNTLNVSDSDDDEEVNLESENSESSQKWYKWPGRGRRCTHRQNFSAAAYLDYAYSQCCYQCPVCNINLPYCDLIFDSEFIQALSQVDRTRPDFIPDESHLLYSSKSNSFKMVYSLNNDESKVDVVDLVLSSSSDSDTDSAEFSSVPQVDREEPDFEIIEPESSQSTRAIRPRPIDLTEETPPSMRNLNAHTYPVDWNDD